MTISNRTTNVIFTVTATCAATLTHYQNIASSQGFIVHLSSNISVPLHLPVSSVLLSPKLSWTSKMLHCLRLPQNPRAGLSDRQCSFKTQKHIDSHSDYSCPLSALYSKATFCCPLLRFFPTERNKAGLRCIAFGVRVEKGSSVWNKDSETSPLRGHLRGAPFALSWAVGWKNGRRSRRGKHHTGGWVVPYVFMKDSLMKGRKNVCWFPISNYICVCACVWVRER